MLQLADRWGREERSGIVTTGWIARVGGLVSGGAEMLFIKSKA